VPGVERFTHVGRVIDPRNPSNLFALAVSGAAGAAGLVLGGSLGAGISAGLATFLAWALGRELDPDRPWTAGAAAVATGAVSLAIPAEAGTLAVLLVAARVTLRPTGLPPTVLDLVGLTVVAGFFARSPAGWSAGMALAFALARDTTLPPPAERTQLGFAAAAAVLVTAVATLTDALGGPWQAPDAYEATIAALGLIAGITLPRETPRSRCDATPAIMSDERLQWARWTVLGALVLAGVVGGGPALGATAGGWLALTSTGLGARVRRSET
jgi:hypothetical protein